MKTVFTKIFKEGTIMVLTIIATILISAYLLTTGGITFTTVILSILALEGGIFVSKTRYEEKVLKNYKK